MRRAWQFVVMLLAIGILLPGGALAQSITVTLLGTGCPPPVMHRFGPSILVEAGNHKFLFDAGRGALQRLHQTKVRWHEITGVFLTHFHSDHLVGFPDLWLTGWNVAPRRDVPIKVWGPIGTVKMMSHLTQAFEEDISIRIEDDRAEPRGAVIEAKDIAEGVAFDEGGVKVTAFTVDHGPVKPALGYRVDYNGHSVVLSGDTRFSENLISFGAGADVVIHEVVSVAALQRVGVPEGHLERVVGHHTLPEEAGEVFARIQPKLAVYSHIAHPTATTDDLVPLTRAKYKGRLEVGEDLMKIAIGDTVEVVRAQ